MKDFAQLLSEQSIRRSVVGAITSPPNNERANKTCSFEEFIEMVRKVIINIVPECEFVPQDEITEKMFPDIKIDKSIISFEVISRRPYKEQKPMFRHEVVENVDNEEARIGSLYAWTMDYIIQFNIYASGYEKSQTVMNIFEEAILKYVGYFKKNGIKECLFSEQIRDAKLDTFREHASIKSVKYQAILEKYWIDFDNVLDSIHLKNNE